MASYQQRFSFGRNWTRFLSVLTEERILRAEASLSDMLGRQHLDGVRFLDAGCGSGLFSLAARRRGARVVSFDFDPDSVACAAQLRERFFPGDSAWEILQGSVLDRSFLATLGQCDIVYSWGVLHHTGDLWLGLARITEPLAPGGQLFIAIYNDQGLRSKAWRLVKRFYCSGRPGRLCTMAAGVPAMVCACLLRDVLRGTSPLRRYTRYEQERGMAVWYDWVDWLGGYPFEVARPSAIRAFYAARGLHLQRERLTGGWGNNEFVFQCPGG